MDLTSEIFTSILSPVATFKSTSPTAPAAATATSPQPVPHSPPPRAAQPNLIPTREPQPEPTSPKERRQTRQEQEQEQEHAKQQEWSSSHQNPATRPNTLSLPLPEAASFRIDGVDSTGTRFFAIPNFALDRPPLRIDVYVPPPEAWPARLREVVRPEKAVSCSSASATTRGRRVARTEVGRWLVGVLQGWVDSINSKGGNDNGHGSSGRSTCHGKRVDGKGKGNLKVVEELWWALPYGSFLQVDFYHGGEAQVHVVPEYAVEQDMLSIEKLRELWAGEVDDAVWEGLEFGAVEWERLEFKRQVHEAVALVTVGGRELAFKSLLRQQRDMYHELKMLLVLERHPNLIPRPVGIVTKKGRFGNRRGVCGFLLEWYPLGSLRERLLRDDYDTSTSMEQRFRWARQVVAALVHVNGHPSGFYPDLKPDNILLRQDAETGLLDAVLIDLEQRGGWFSWSPPEVRFIEYLEILAGSADTPEDLRLEFLTQLREYYGNSSWEPETSSNQRYHSTEGGFSGPWLALLGARRAGKESKDLLELAQVYMLGKLLWCIFEGQPFVRSGIDHEVLRDTDPEYESRRTGKAMAFPEFRKTPGALRPLIRACTAGAPEWGADGASPRHEMIVALRGGKLYPANPRADLGVVTVSDTLESAREFWQREVKQARSFMSKLLASGQGHRDAVESPTGLRSQVLLRPTFSVISSELARIERLLT